MKAAMISAIAMMVGYARADLIGVSFGGSFAVFEESDGSGGFAGDTMFTNLNSMAFDGVDLILTASTSSPPRLLRIDPVLGTASPFHLPFLNDIRAMAFSPNGQLYAMDGGGPQNRLYTLDLSVSIGDSSIKSVVGDPDITGIQAMVFADDGTLYAWSVGAGLLTVDPLTAAAVNVSGVLDGTSAIQTLAFGPDGSLYGAHDELFVVNVATGQATLVGSDNWGAVRGMVFRGDVPLTYCQAKTNSQGCVPFVSSTGSASLSGPDDFVIRAQSVLAGPPGLYFWGFDGASIPFLGGTLCVQPPLARTLPQLAGGAPPCGGSYAFAFDQTLMSQAGLVAGDAVFGQFWSRDQGFPPPNNVGLTGGLIFEIQP